MKTDTIFYSIFQTFPSSFFELINQSPSEAVTYEFTSHKIKNIKAMLWLSELKQTRAYQEALEEGKQETKLEIIPRMISLPHINPRA